MAYAQNDYWPGRVDLYDGIIPPQTGQIIAKQAVEAIQDYRVHNEARRLIAHVFDQNDSNMGNVAVAEVIARISEITAVYNYVREKIRYTYDPIGIELVYHPSFLYQKNGPLDRYSKWAEDCDTIALLTATFLMSLGHKVRITIVGFNRQRGYSHVFSETWIKRLGWLVVDPALGPKVPRMLKDITHFKHFYPNYG